jgi:hypothetical protein
VKLEEGLGRGSGGISRWQWSSRRARIMQTEQVPGGQITSLLQERWTSPGWQQWSGTLAKRRRSSGVTRRLEEVGH